jgi:ABC-type transport system involved in multi-copper enzyme maturation permease subunit
MNRVAQVFWNPIVAKEYRSRMRTWRSPVAMMVYIVLIGGLGWATFASMTSFTGGPFGSGQPSAYGQTLFTTLIVFQVVLLAFITPALTAGAISGERERQTIDLLFVTRIPPFSIIWGKLLASMSFVVLLLILSVPIFSLVFLFGGIELDQVVYAFIVTAVTALTLGLLGIAFSSWFKRTLPSTVAAYGAAFVLFAGTLLYGLILPTDVDPQASSLPAPPAITLLSPILPLVTIATNAPVSLYGVRYPNLQNGGGYSCSSSGGGPQVCYSIGSSGVPSNVVVTKGGFPGSPQPLNATLPTGLFKGWQYWQANVVMQLVICVIALAFSAFMLQRRLPWRRQARPAAERAS